MGQFQQELTIVWEMTRRKKQKKDKEKETTGKRDYRRQKKGEKE